MIKTESKYYIYDKPKKINVKYIVKQIIYTIQNILYGLYMKTIFVNLGEKKYKVSICAIFKNEGKYLREWIEFHRIIGIEHFYLYNNNSDDNYETVATVYKGNIIKNLIMDCQSYTKYRPNETTGGIFVSWRRKEELPTGA